MTDYIKLYNTFFTGSMRKEDAETRLFFLSLISSADPNGIVTGMVDFLAMYAGIPVEAAKVALVALQSPDPDSSTPDEDGRRLEAWGPNRWRIINHKKYFEKSREEDRKQYKLEWDRLHSETRHKSGKTRQNPTEPDKNPTEPDKPDKPDRSVVECSGTESKVAEHNPPTPRGGTTEDFDQLWKAYPHARPTGKKPALSSYQKQLKAGARHPEIMEGVAAYQGWLVSHPDKREYAPSLVVWLNQARWDEVLPDVVATNGRYHPETKAERYARLGIDPNEPDEIE